MPLSIFCLNILHVIEMCFFAICVCIYVCICTHIHMFLAVYSFHCNIGRNMQSTDYHIHNNLQVYNHKQLPTYPLWIYGNLNLPCNFAIEITRSAATSVFIDSMMHLGLLLSGLKKRNTSILMIDGRGQWPRNVIGHLPTMSVFSKWPRATGRPGDWS